MTNINDLAKLISSGDTEGIRAALKQSVGAPLSDADRGQALVMLGMLYIQLKNQNDRSLLADLTEAMTTLKSITKSENELKDAQNLAGIRAKLAT